MMCFTAKQENILNKEYLRYNNKCGPILEYPFQRVHSMYSYCLKCICIYIYIPIITYIGRPLRVVKLVLQIKYKQNNKLQIFSLCLFKKNKKFQQLRFKNELQ